MTKKQMITEYKFNQPDFGIFQIRNLENGKIFIGKGQNLQGIMNSAQYQLSLGNFSNQELQADYNRLGKDKFAFEVLDELPPGEKGGETVSQELNALEELMLEKLKAYNLTWYNHKPR